MFIPEVIKVQGPNHCSSQPHVFDVLRLVRDHGCVIKGDPLRALVGVRAHGSLRVLDHLPALVHYVVADLVVGQEAGGPRELARLAFLSGRRVEAVVTGLVQGEGLSVQGHAHDQLAGRGPGFDPVVDGVVLE